MYSNPRRRKFSTTSKGQASLEALLISAIFLSFLAMFSIPAINLVQEGLEKQESSSNAKNAISWIEEKYEEIKIFGEGTRFSRKIEFQKESLAENNSGKICIENDFIRECSSGNILAPITGNFSKGQNEMIVEKRNFGIRIKIQPA